MTDATKEGMDLLAKSMRQAFGDTAGDERPVLGNGEASSERPVLGNGKPPRDERPVLGNRGNPIRK